MLGSGPTGPESGCPVSLIRKWILRSDFTYYTYRQTISCNWVAFFLNTLGIEYNEISSGKHSEIPKLYPYRRFSPCRDKCTDGWEERDSTTGLHEFDTLDARL